jgi:hypothetical protein
LHTVHFDSPFASLFSEGAGPEDDPPFPFNIVCWRRWAY